MNLNNQQRAVFIVLVTLAVYLPAIRGGFVWDDYTLITENRLVKANDGLYRFWCTTEAAEYYPLTYSLWWLEWRLWGATPMGYHVVNVLLHAVNAILVWIILRRLKIPGAWFAAVVFAIHPVNAATVAWICEQKSTLSMLFYTVAILLYLRFDEEHCWRWYGLSLAAFLLALLAKTAVVMLPIVLLGCVWWTRGQARWKDVLYSSPFFILSAGLGLLTIRVHHSQLVMESAARAAGFASRLATAGWVPWFYLSKALLPFNLTAVYPQWQVDASRWVSYVPGLILAGSLTLFWWNRNTWGRPFFFGFGYFVAMLFPVLGFFDQSFYRFSLVADHWQYYSLAGVVGLVGAMGCRISGQTRAVAGVAVLTVLGLMTSERAGVYASEETLWRDTVEKNPAGWMPHYNLGTILLQAGKLEEAIVQFEQAARLRPDLVKVHSNLGIALAQAGRVQEAVAQFERALQIDPHLFEVHGNLGHALMIQGKMPEAITHWKQALQIKPESADVHYDLGLALEQIGQIAEAIKHYELALKFKPDYTEARQALARLQAHGVSGQR